MHFRGRQNDVFDAQQLQALLAPKGSPMTSLPILTHSDSHSSDKKLIVIDSACENGAWHGGGVLDSPAPYSCVVLVRGLLDPRSI